MDLDLPPDPLVYVGSREEDCRDLIENSKDLLYLTLFPPTNFKTLIFRKHRHGIAQSQTADERLCYL